MPHERQKRNGKNVAVVLVLSLFVAINIFDQFPEDSLQDFKRRAFAVVRNPSEELPSNKAQVNEFLNQLTTEDRPSNMTQWDEFFSDLTKSWLENNRSSSEKDEQSSKNSTTGNSTCPLDRFIGEDCSTRFGGTVCIFPNVILKKTYKNVYRGELRSFDLLNDTRFFPKLLYHDDECETLLIENVRPSGKRFNEWTSNYTHYKLFYEKVFRVFAENNIYPEDLNACCNTIVNGNDIRIIDFGKYMFPHDWKKWNSTNYKLKLDDLLSSILEDVKRETDKSKRKRARGNGRSASMKG